jgi:hypothetical protein
VTTTELPMVGAPPCRHLLAVRGGSLACTLPAGHPPGEHADEDLTGEEDRHPSWTCSCRPAVLEASVSVCLTWRGYS